MKKKKRSYTVYLAGELFSLKHLIGNAWLAESIYEKSHGRFRCVLPQDFFELRGRSTRVIRDYNLRALVACDLALFNFDGPDLDSGTVVEFMFAKFADIPAVLVRSDIRGGGDSREAPWNIMATHFPRTTQVIVPSLFEYRGALRRRHRRSDHAVHLAAQHSSVAGQHVCDVVAQDCVHALERAMAIPAILPKDRRETTYDWLALCAGLDGKRKELRKEFTRQLERKIERDLL